MNLACILACLMSQQNVPLEGRPAEFTGYVGRFTLNARIENARIVASQPIEYTITITGKGTLGRPPDLRTLAAFTETFTITGPARTITEERDATHVRYEFRLSANRPDVDRIPSLRWSFYDPEKRRFETLFAPAIDIQIAAAPAVTADDVQPPERDTADAPRSLPPMLLGIVGLAIAGLLLLIARRPLANQREVIVPPETQPSPAPRVDAPRLDEILAALRDQRGNDPQWNVIVPRVRVFLAHALSLPIGSTTTPELLEAARGRLPEQFVQKLEDVLSRADAFLYSRRSQEDSLHWRGRMEQVLQELREHL